MIITKKFVEEINGLVGDITLIFRGYKTGPRLSRITTKDLVIGRVEFNVIFFQVCIEFVCAQHLCDFDKLIIVVMAMEKGLLSENLCKYVSRDLRNLNPKAYHRCKHATQTPHVKTVVVFLEVDK